MAGISHSPSAWRSNARRVRSIASEGETAASTASLSKAAITPAQSDAIGPVGPVAVATRSGRPGWVGGGPSCVELFRAMGQKNDHARELWALAERQHGVIARNQLLWLGLTTDTITQRLGTGRLHRVFRGVYAVGRPGLTRHGRWMAAVLACGPRAVVSHGTAAALWEIGRERSRVPEVVRTQQPAPAADRHRGSRQKDR